MYLVSCTNTHRDVIDSVNHGMVKNTKTWISWERNIIFLRNEKILNLCLTWHILGSYRFVAEVTFKMGQKGEQDMKRKHSLFLINNITAKASLDTGACYGVKRSAKIVFWDGMIKVNGLKISEDKKKALNPENKEVHKFLGCHSWVKIDIKRVIERVTNKVNKWTVKLVELNLNDINLRKAINYRRVPVSRYVNICM